MSANKPELCGIPVEVTRMIIDYLAKEKPPSVRQFAQEPSRQMIESQEQPLKHLSLCNRRMYQLTKDCIFRHTMVKMRPSPPQRKLGGFDPPSPSLKSLYEFTTFLRRRGIMGKEMTVTIYFPRGRELNPSCRKEFAEKLTEVLMKINPNRLTIIATAEMLATLCGLQCGTTYQDVLKRTHHALELGKPRLRPGPRYVKYSTKTKSVLTMRPWSTLRLNENNGICWSGLPDPLRAMRQSILNIYHGSWGFVRPSPFLCVRHFEYIAFHPGAKQIEMFARAMNGCRCLESITTQLIIFRGNPQDDICDHMRSYIIDPCCGLARSYQMIATYIAAKDQQKKDRHRLLLKKWHVRDDTDVVDPVLGADLPGWESKEPGVWGRIAAP
ncbi:MAG: hypothetical protein Q9174_002519 [Haloplaca sp. 1 TL-2023]